MAESYDVRGRQSSILRLYGFDKEGLLHMVFYRAAIFVAVLLIASIALGVAYAHTPFTIYTEILMLVMWVLFTPQLFETFKASSIIASGGVVFGRLNASFMRFGVRRKPWFVIYSAVPYVAMAVWACGFVILAYLWLA